jgi:hypothetical protein
MTCFLRKSGLLAATALVLLSAPAWADAPNGKPRPMRAHPGNHPNPPGLLPLATPMQNAAAGIAMPYSGPPIDVTTFHYDNNRTGWNNQETDLTPATVASAKFGLLKTLKVDGRVFAQPLLVSGFVLPDGSTHNILIVATAHNSVYAFDAATYKIIWQVNLGQSQSTNDVGCSDVQPEYGIASTPVILRTGANAATLYVVSATEPSPFSFQTNLHALDIGTGQDIAPPALINPSAPLSDGSTLAFNPQDQWSRAGLAMANGKIYVGIGSHCDNGGGDETGWLLGYGTDLSPFAAFHTIKDSSAFELASIWMAGFAPAIDASGNVFVTTGNGDTAVKAGHKDYGESVLRLPSTLAKVESSFTPADYNTLNQNDLDFASGGVMLVPPVAGQKSPPLAVTMGKEAVLYLLNQTSLGGLKPKDSGVLQAMTVGTAGSGVRGGPSFYASPSGPLVYIQIDADFVRSYALNTSATPSLTPFAAGTTRSGYGGSMPVISSNGAAASTGVLWLVRRGTTVDLEAYDATTLGAPIFSAGAGQWSGTGQSNAFVSAMEANGRVYVPAYKTVTVFGLTP